MNNINHMTHHICSLTQIRFIKAFLLHTIVVVLFSTPKVWGQNIIDNGGFENGTGNWSGYFNSSYSGSFSIVNSNSHSGNKAAKIQVNSIPSNPLVYNVQLRNNTFYADSGHAYHISLWMKASSNLDVQIIISQNNSPWAWVGAKTVNLSTVYEQYDLYIPNCQFSTKNGLRFAVRCGNSIGSIYIDDVVITDCTKETGEQSLQTAIYGEGTVYSESKIGTSEFLLSSTQNYAQGDSITLTYQSEPGYSFNGWSGACSGTGPCTIVMNSNKIVSAHFEKSSSIDECIDYRNQVDWSIAGYNGVIPYDGNIIDMTQPPYSCIGDGSTNNYDAIKQALDDVKNLSGFNILYFPAGDYFVKGYYTLYMPDSTIIRGACASNTTFSLMPQDTTFIDGNGKEKKYIGNAVFAISKTGNTISKYGDTLNILGGYTLGSSVLSIPNTTDINVGDIIEVWQSNDSSKMYSNSRMLTSSGDASAYNDAFEDWARNAVGEIAKVTAKNNNQIHLDRKLHLNYKPHLKPKIRRLGMAKDVGFENLKIHRISDPSFSENTKDNVTIMFDRAYNCWVRNVEMSWGMKSHIWIRRSYKIEVRDSYFHHAYDRGGGGHGYGVTMNTHVTSCLVEHNAFNSLRHAMIVSVGANGNVFGYNYSRDSWDPAGNSGFGDQKADISIHGFYPFMNLFEGNIVEFMHSADWWGASGPGNTFFRNRASEKPMTVWDNSDYQNIIGNELTNTMLSGNNFEIENSCQNTNRHSNNDRGDIDVNKINTLPPSLYKSSPNFNHGFAFPNIGPMPGFNNSPYPIEQHLNKAKYRYQWNSAAPCITLCSDSEMPNDIDTCSSPINISVTSPSTSKNLYGIIITSIPGTYNDFEPFEGDPELYYKIKSGSTTLYTSPVAPTSQPDVYITADFLNLDGSSIYTVEVYEDDVSNDDYLGAVSFNSSSSATSFSSAVSGGTLSIKLDKVSTTTEYKWSNGGNTNTNSFNDSGNYTITITDENGCISEDEINIKIDKPLVIVKDIASFQNICQGGNTDSLIFEVSGGAGIKYQWYKIQDSIGGAINAINGANTSHFIPSNLTTGTSFYYCLAEDTLNPDCGKDSSSFSKVIVNEGIYINQEPLAYQRICEGGNLNNLTVGVTSGVSYTYQWYVYSNQNTSAAPISGGNYYWLSLNPNIAPDTYFYYCIITSSSNGCNQVISDTAKVIVEPDLNINGTNITDQLFCYGDSAINMFVISNGGVNPTYQWYESSSSQTYAGIPISNATDSIYTPPSNNIGERYYYCKISDTTNGCSSYNHVSNIASVSIEESVYISAQTKQDNSYCDGYGNVNLSVSTNNNNAQYQWYSSSLNYYTGNAISGATNYYYYAPLSMWGSNFYYCVISNSALTNCGQDTSHIFKVTGTGQPTLTQQPQSQSICEGDSLSSLSTYHTGGVSPYYQWYYNSNSNFSGSTPISGANNLVFSPSDTLPGNYYYFLLVSDSNTSCYPDTSNYAHIGIYENIKITKEPIPYQSICEGETPDTIGFEGQGGTGWGLQWLINTDSSYNGAQTAPNAYSPYFIPPDTLSIGSHYYFAVFTDIGFSQCGADTSIISHVKVLGEPISDFSFSDSMGLINFEDQSQHATKWEWIFGDGDSSKLRDPQHQYDSSGIYNAILIASNQCGSDSTSKQISIISTYVYNKSQSINIYPNPSESQSYLQLNNQTPTGGELIIYDIKGAIVNRQKITNPIEKIDLTKLLKGQYKLVYTKDKLRISKSLIIQ